MNKPFFAGRTADLDQLTALAEQAFAGKAQIAFITGEAGMGKSALACELLRRVQEKQENAVAACGKCTVREASYLPFRTILEQLSGSEKQVQESGGKLRKVAEFTVETVWTVGPELIGIFGTPIKALQKVVEKQGLRSGTTAPAVTTPQDLNPQQIYGWYTKIMQEVSAKFPLLLFLDDLHWADESSLNLLFHLGRELENRRIFLIATFRPHEISERLAEIKNRLERYGAREFSLDVSTEGEKDVVKIRDFVHSFLTEKYGTNFSGQFEQLLAERTRGNALFLAELLKNMEEKGQLTCEKQNGMVVRCHLAEGLDEHVALPGKIEAVLRERVDRLDKDLQEPLTVASVQGDDFLVQVVAKIQQTDCWELIDTLSKELMNRHQLIYDRDGKDLANGNRVHVFSFRHNLLRQYVYDRIPKAKKEHLHAETGARLEELHQPDADEIAGVLAVHFHHGHVLPKAVAYSLKAAENANIRYGTAEAVRCAGMGLEALEQGKRNFSLQEYLENKIRLVIELAKAEEYGGDPQEKKDHIQFGIKLLEEHLPLVEQVAEKVQADFYTEFGRLYYRKGGKQQEAKTWFEKALLLYERNEDQKQAAELCYLLGDIYQFILSSSGNQTPLEQSIAVLQKGLSIAEQIQDMPLQSRILSRLTWRLGKKNISTSKMYAQQALTLSRASKNHYAETRALAAMAYVCRRRTQQKTSVIYLKKALDIARKTGNSITESEILNDIGFDCSDYMSIKNEGQRAYKESLAVKEKIGTKKIFSLNNLGWSFAKQGKWNKAKSCLMEAIEQSSERETSQSHYQYKIGRVYMFQEKYEQAEPIFLHRIKIIEKYKLSYPVVFICTAQNYAKLDKKIESKKLLTISFEKYKAVSGPNTKASYLHEYAETCRLLKEYETARSACKKSLTWLLNNAEDPDDYQPVAEARLIMGKILVDMQSFREALPYLEKAKAAFAIGRHYALGETMLYLGKAHLELNHGQKGKELLIRALTEFQRLGLRKKEAEARRLLGLRRQ
ncbi:MAG: AAA family ATPase [Candidatus Electrothrix sp. YB6]